MRYTGSKWVFAFLLLLEGWMSNAQSHTAQLNEWISELSVKKDFQYRNFVKVSTDLSHLDSTQNRETLSRLEEMGPKKNLRFRIRLILLKYNYRARNISRDDWQPVADMLKDGLVMAYESEDKYLIVLLNQNLYSWYDIIGDYGSAGMYGLITKEMQESLGIENFTFMAYGRYDLGFILFHSREYEASIESSREAIFWSDKPGASPSDSLSEYYKMNAWNTIGLGYEKLEKYDSAFVAFKNAFAIAKKEKELFWTGLIEGNMGDVYFKMGQYDTAQILLLKDVRQSISSGQYDNAANSMQWLARIDAFHDKALLGLHKLREASQFLQRSPNVYFLTNTYEAFTIVFQKLSKADSLYLYMKKYQTLHDSLERIASVNRAEIVSMRLDNEIAVHKILFLNKEKRRITLVRNFTIGIILLLSGLAYVDFKRQKLKIQLQRQEALEQKRQAEKEVENAREQLKEFTLNALEKSNLIENLQQQLLQREITSEQHQDIIELTHQTLLTDADWDKFKALFEKVFPGFFIKLRELAIDITQAELRMAALIRLQLTTKESAALLGVSQDTIHKTRQRLKQRLQLSPDADLDHLILSI
jgi:tetratricopeptide (TPR) repeat protein